MSDAAEQAVLKVLDRGPAGLMDMWLDPSLRHFTVDVVGMALVRLTERRVIEAEPKSLRYRINPEQIPPNDLNRALDETY